jgi:uncharacterized protein HemY
VLKEARRLAEKYPNVPSYKRFLFRFHYVFGRLLVQQGKRAEAEGELRAALVIAQKLDGEFLNEPNYHNSLAWMLATCPVLKLRDSGQAVAHAQKVVELEPGSSNSWNTLGVAQYCNGEWKAAVESLMKSVQLHKGGGHSIDFFFLAMSHWQLGEKDKARAWYAKGVAWMDEHRPQDEELKRFRVEATALLGLAKEAQTQNKKD